MKYLFFILVIVASCDSSIKENPIAINKQDEPVVKSFNNPVLIYGSSFGEFFQTLYRQNKFGDMVKFTSKETRNKFVDSTLLGFYRNTFHFDFQLNKLTAIEKNGDTINLIYSNAQILGTKRKITIPIIIENDSSKIIIYSLKNPFKYLP